MLRVGPRRCLDSVLRTGVPSAWLAHSVSVCHACIISAKSQTARAASVCARLGTCCSLPSIVAGESTNRPSPSRNLAPRPVRTLLQIRQPASGRRRPRTHAPREHTSAHSRRAAAANAQRRTRTGSGPGKSVSRYRGGGCGCGCARAASRDRRVCRVSRLLEVFARLCEDVLLERVLI